MTLRVAAEMLKCISVKFDMCVYEVTEGTAPIVTKFRHPLPLNNYQQMFKLYL